MDEFKFWIPILFLLISLFIHDGKAKLLPDYIHLCKENDNVCLPQSVREALPHFVKGLPELGIPPLDPLDFDKISVSLNGLKISFFDGKITGFRKCIVDKSELIPQKHRMIMELHCNITVKGKYEAVGRMLLFPINGEGDAKIKLTNLGTKIQMYFKYVKDDKQVIHYAIDNYKYNFDCGDKVTFNMTNIIKGQPEISATILQFLNENWRQITEEFGKPLVDYAVELCVKTIEKFFLAIPYDELIDGPAHMYE